MYLSFQSKTIKELQCMKPSKWDLTYIFTDETSASEHMSYACRYKQPMYSSMPPCQPYFVSTSLVSYTVQFKSTLFIIYTAFQIVFLLPSGVSTNIPKPIATQLFDLRAILSFCLVDRLGRGLTANVVKFRGLSVISREMS